MKSIVIEANRLFKANESLGMCDPDMETRYELYDRVISVRLGTGVPVGTRGTIIGVLLGQTHLDTYYEVLFDHLPKNSLDAILLGGNNQPCRIKVRSYHLLNYSHSLRTRSMPTTQQQRSMPAENAWERRTVDQTMGTTRQGQVQQPTRILKRGSSDNTAAATSTTTTTTITAKPKSETASTPSALEKPKSVDIILASAKEQSSTTKSPILPLIEKPTVSQVMTESAFLSLSQPTMNKTREPIQNPPGELSAPIVKPSAIETLLLRAMQDANQLQNSSPSIPLARQMNIPSTTHSTPLWTNPNGQPGGIPQQNLDPLRNHFQTWKATGAPQSQATCTYHIETSHRHHHHC